MANIASVFDTKRVTKSKAENGIPYLICFCDKLKQEQKEEILSYKNTRLGHSRSEYAPELKKDIVFLYDKNL